MKYPKINHSKSKGFALTFDSMIGIFVMTIAILFIGGQQFDLGSSQILVQKNLADDLVELSIDLNKIQTFDQNTINDFFEEALPKNYQYNLRIDSYTGTGGTLVAGPSYIYGDDLTNLDDVDYIESRGSFLKFSGTQSADIGSYNLVKLKIWVKGSKRQLPNNWDDFYE